MISEKQYYAEKRVSSSSLKWFEESPKMFRKQLDKEIAQINLSWLETGRQIHMSVLEPDLFEKSYIYLDYNIPKSANQKEFCEEYVNYQKGNDPLDEELAKIAAYEKAYNTKGKSEDKVKEESDKLYKSLRHYIEYLEKSKEYKEVMTKSKWDLIQNLKQEVQSHKLASKLMFDSDEQKMNNNYESHNEFVIFWEYPEIDGHRTQCKSMIDRFVIDRDNKVIKLIDVKTTSNIGTFKKSVDHYKYHRQLAFYWMAIFYEFKDVIPDIETYTQETYIVALSTNPELPECKVVTIEESMLVEGIKDIQKQMNKIAWHYKNDLWDYSKEYYEGDGTESLIDIEEVDYE